MSGRRYPEEFKIEAVKQVVDRGHSVSSVATRLDITTHSLYAWIKKYGPDSSTNKEQSDAQAAISEASYYNWKANYGGMEAADIKKIKDLEDENRRLKQMFADLSLECRALKDVIEKKR